MKDVRFSHNTVVLPLTNQYVVSLCMLLLHIKKLLVKILNRLKDMGTLLWIIREFLSCPLMHCSFFFNHRIMSKILKKLSYLDFPENSRQALQYVASCYSDGSTHHGLSIPGLESASENWAYEVCHEYIYFHSSSRRAAQVKKNF